MKKFYFLILLFLPLAAHPQVFAKHYGTFPPDLARDLIRTADGNYVIAGETASAGLFNMYSFKADTSGNMIWSASYGESNFDNARAVVESSDSGLVYAGTTYGFSTSNVDAYIVKTSKTGTLLWSKIFGGSGAEQVADIIAADGGSFLFTGQSGSNGAGETDFMLVKVNSTGNLSWAKVYGTPLVEGADVLTAAYSGGYLIAGETDTDTSTMTANNDIVVVKTDSSGNIQWAKQFMRSGNDYLRSMTGNGSNGYLLCGSFYDLADSSGKAFVISMDTSGNIAWQKSYADGTNTYFSGIKKAADGSLLITSNYGDSPALVSADILGNVNWAKGYPIPGLEDIAGVIERPGNGFMIAGNTAFSLNNYNVYLLSTDPSGDACNVASFNLITGLPSFTDSIIVLQQSSFSVSSSVTSQTTSGATAYTICSGVGIVDAEKPAESIISIYPQPVFSEMQIQLDSHLHLQHPFVEVYDAWGREVKIINIISWRTMVSLTEMNSGIYFYRLFNGNKNIASGRFLRF